MTGGAQPQERVDRRNMDASVLGEKMRYNGKDQNARSATQSELLSPLSDSDQGPVDFRRARILPRG